MVGFSRFSLFRRCYRYIYTRKDTSFMYNPLQGRPFPEISVSEYAGAIQNKRIEKDKKAYLDFLDMVEPRDPSNEKDFIKKKSPQANDDGEQCESEILMT